jgi:dihydrofolate reductase
MHSAKNRDVAMILAIAANGVIGRGGGLPWTEPEDRAHFEATTRGATVIMGRRTWDENGTPLEGRVNIVVSRSFVPPPGVYRAADLDEAVAIAERLGHGEIFVIGGARLFEEAAPRARRVYLTEIPGAPEGDTVFDRGVLERAGLVEVSSRTSASGLRFVVLEPRAR